MSTTLVGWTLGLVAVAAAGVFIALTVLKVRYDRGTRRAALTDWAAQRFGLPDASSEAMHRRFARALFAEHVAMPSGRRCAYPRLTLHVSPDDHARFGAEGDLEGLAEVGARWYREHALGQSWDTPTDITVEVEADPRIRRGWVPVARGHGRPGGEPVELVTVQREPDPAATRMVDEPTPTETFASQWDSAEHIVQQAPTQAQPVVRPDTGVFDAATQAVALGGEATQAVAQHEDDLWLHHDGHLARLPRRSHTIVGRHPASPIPLTDPTISSRHAAIRHDASGWYIKDLGSKNGTCVNGRRLEPGRWTALRSGSIIVVADELMSVRIAADAALASAPSPSVRDT